jgi:hypothetical protein
MRAPGCEILNKPLICKMIDVWESLAQQLEVGMASDESAADEK